MPAPETFAPFFPWVRLALTGKPNAKIGGNEATDKEFRETVTFVGASAIADVLALLPVECRAEAQSYADGSDDQAAFYEAVGAKIACRFLASPSGNEYVNDITQADIGPITEKYAVRSVDSEIGRCSTAAQSAVNRLSCVIAANQAAGSISLVGFAGRERSCRDYGCGYSGERNRY